MSILKNDSGSVRVGDMSVAVSIRSIDDIVNPANIVQWYDAEDLTVGVGNSVQVWNDRSASTDHLVQNSSIARGILDVDSNGFKFVYFDYSSSAKSMATTNSVINADETLIFICERSNIGSAGTMRQNIANSLNRCLYTNSNVQHQITDSTVGSGRQVLSTDTSGKIIISFSRRTSSDPIMRLSKGFNLVSVPMLNTSLPSADIQRYFNSSLADFNIKAYSSITINQYLDDNTLKNLIRSMAFQKCIPLN